MFLHKFIISIKAALLLIILEKYASPEEVTFEYSFSSFNKFDWVLFSSSLNLTISVMSLSLANAPIMFPFLS